MNAIKIILYTVIMAVFVVSTMVKEKKEAKKKRKAKSELIISEK